MSLNKDDALQALEEGKRLTHQMFTSDEWMEQCGLVYVFEDGTQCDIEEFWSYRTAPVWLCGWSIL